MNWIEITRLKEGNKVSVNLNEVRAIAEDGDSCQIHYINHTNFLNTKESYKEVIKLIKESEI